MLRSKVTFEKI